MADWKVSQGMARSDMAVKHLQKFVDWCATHENHAPVKILSEGPGGAIACQQCKAVFVILGGIE